MGPLLRRFPALTHADFAWLWAAGTASSIALWTLILGNAWVVFKLSDSSSLVGVATFASLSPFLLSPIGGVVADRVERLHILKITRAGAILTTAVVLALAIAGVLEPWIVIAVALAQGLVRSGEMPAEQALIPNVVARNEIANAIMLSTTSRLGSRAIGPLLAGPLLATIGVEGAYAIALVFAVLAFVLLFRVRARSHGGVSDIRRAVEGLGQGLRYVRENQGVLAVFALVVAHCTLTMSFDALLPGFAERNLDTPTNGYTVLSVAVGAGAFLGTLGLALSADRGRGVLFLTTGIVSGLAPVLLAISGTLPAGALGAAAMGGSQAMFMALASVFIQESVDDAFRGRVMSLYLMSAGGLMAFANLGSGTLADVYGAPAMLIVPGGAFIAIILGSLLIAPNLRRVYAAGVIPRLPA